MRHIVQIWRRLSPRQRTVALKALGFKAVVLSRRKSRALVRQWWVEPAAESGPDDYGDPTFKRNVFLEKLAGQFVPIYEARLGLTLKLKIVAGTAASPATLEDSPYADASPMDKDGTYSANPDTCRIRVFPPGQSLDPMLQKLTMAHEVFHCFQFDITGSSAGPDWIIEGTAEWAAFSVFPVQWQTGEADWLKLYFSSCATTGLLQRSYDAAVFFGHASDVFGDIWPRIPAILKGSGIGSTFPGGGNQIIPVSYVEAGGLEPEFLESWGSSVALLSSWGFAWTTTRPIFYPKDWHCGLLPLWSDGILSSDAYKLSLYGIAQGDAPPDSPLLHVEIFEGSARLGDGKVDTTFLEDAWFCLAEHCVCPAGQEGSPPPAINVGPFVLLGMTGGPTGASGRASFASLKEFCKEKSPPPPPPVDGPPGVCSAAGCGFSNGDPHLMTFDTHFYDFQAAGEFTLVRSRRGDLEVQVRQEPYPGSRLVSINTAVAMRVGPARVGIYRGEPLRIRVDGRPLVLAKRPVALRGGGRVSKLAGQVEVGWPDGTVARTWSVGQWGVGVLLNLAPSRKGTVVGLLGNFDGRRGNEFATRRGRRIDLEPKPPPSAYHRLLYRRFGDSWRVARRGSLFDYSRGQSTRTFTNRRFPARLYGPDELPQSVRRRAAAACRRQGVRKARILRDCMLDFGVTRDRSFVTASAVLQRTSRVRPSESRRGGAETRWTFVARAGQSGLATPSLAREGGKIVATYLTGPGSAEAVTFAPSTSTDVQALRRVALASGWGSLGDPVLMPRAGGGLQVRLSGIQGSFFGVVFVPRNPDGTFGAPVPATSDAYASGGGAGVLAPDGAPLWPGSYGGNLSLWRGATAAVGAKLQAIAGPPGSRASVPALARDARGRYWLAWYSIAPGFRARAAGIYIVQVDPVRLVPLGAPQRAPGSAASENALDALDLVCRVTCRVVYFQQPGGRGSARRIASWSPGEAKATLVVDAGKHSLLQLTAAYAPSGRLWVAWWDLDSRMYWAALGDGRGARSVRFSIGRPAGKVLLAGGLGSVTAGENLVLAGNWQSSSKTFARYVNVIPPR
jgi:hypothetical protein